MFSALKGRRIYMEDVALIVSMLLLFLLGWFVMVRLDRILDDKQMWNDSACESRPTPRCIVLPGNLMAEDLSSKLQRFRDIHPNTQILFLDSDTYSLDEILSAIEYKR